MVLTVLSTGAMYINSLNVHQKYRHRSRTHENVCRYQQLKYVRTVYRYIPSNRLTEVVRGPEAPVGPYPVLKQSIPKHSLSCLPLTVSRAYLYSLLWLASLWWTWLLFMPQRAPPAMTVTPAEPKSFTETVKYNCDTTRTSHTASSARTSWVKHSLHVRGATVLETRPDPTSIVWSNHLW